MRQVPEEGLVADVGLWLDAEFAAHQGLSDTIGHKRIAAMVDSKEAAADGRFDAARLADTLSWLAQHSPEQPVLVVCCCHCMPLYRLCAWNQYLAA